MQEGWHTLFSGSSSKSFLCSTVSVKINEPPMDNDPVLRSYLEFVSRVQKRWPVLAKLLGFGILFWIAYSVYEAIWAAAKF